MEKPITVSVQEGLEYQEFVRYMEGYIAGVQAAANLAVAERREQFSRRATAIAAVQRPATEPAEPQKP